MYKRQDIKANDLAMEFEFDDALLEKTAGSEVYRRRLREYMDGAKAVSYTHLRSSIPTERGRRTRDMFPRRFTMRNTNFLS